VDVVAVAAEIEEEDEAEATNKRSTNLVAKTHNNGNGTGFLVLVKIAGVDVREAPLYLHSCVYCHFLCSLQLGSMHAFFEHKNALFSCSPQLKVAFSIA
jgi:hypothetical protein